MASILFTDPGMQAKKVEFDPEVELFFNIVLREGERYTTADCFQTKQRAWRPFTGEWRSGSFSQEVLIACLIQGFDPGSFNVKALRDMYDYEGLSINEVALQLIHRDKSTIRPIRGSLAPPLKQNVK